jgi:hypothetical protein
VIPLLTVRRELLADMSSGPSKVTPDNVPLWDSSPPPVTVPPLIKPVSATVPIPAAPVVSTLPVLVSVPSMNTVPPALLTEPIFVWLKLPPRCNDAPLPSAIVPWFEKLSDAEPSRTVEPAPPTVNVTPAALVKTTPVASK